MKRLKLETGILCRGLYFEKCKEKTTIGLPMVEKNLQRLSLIHI